MDVVSSVNISSNVGMTGNVLSCGQCSLVESFIFIASTMYEGQLISNAHSEIFCQRSIVAMLAQCVLVATTLLQSGAKFHSFLYAGSKTVHVNMESCYGGMSTRLKQCAVTEFLSAENVTPAEIHRRLQAVYGKTLLTELQ